MGNEKDTKIELSSHENEERELALQAKRLEIKEREANLQDVTERLAERELRREMLRMRARNNGATIAQINRDIEGAQRRCNHHKGGDGAHGIIGGYGMDGQYAVIKHSMANGDMWVICLRCGKKWKPPIRSHFESEATYSVALADYKAACQFMTRNIPSSSSQFKWSDGGEFYRESVANS